MQMMYITNDVNIAQIAQANTVDVIFVDLETIGKSIRQANLDTVQSHHSMDDVSRVRNALTTSELLVRVNPLHYKSKIEIDEVIKRGADIVMLPMFYTATDAARFVDMVNGRAKVLLLVETIQAEENIAQISDLDGVDGIHIGLNDLHLAYDKDFMFELLADGNVETMCKTIGKRKIPYGFGGIARINEGTIPSKNIIAEHYRLGSCRAILSRTFCNTEKISDLDEIQRRFSTGMKEIREFEQQLLGKPGEFFRNNQKEVIEKTKIIVNQLRRSEVKKCI